MPEGPQASELDTDAVREGNLTDQPNGAIIWKGHRIFISRALVGWSIGLEPAGEGKYHVWFVRLLLGHLDEKAFAFIPAQRGEPELPDEEE